MGDNTEYHKKYREENKETINANSRKFYQNNKERLNKNSKEYYKQNKHKMTERNKKYTRSTKYGISQEQYDDMLDKQGHKCNICKEALDMDRATHVDHCHKTGRVRGILCRTCNLGLGHFKDRAELLLSAWEHLS